VSVELAIGLRGARRKPLRAFSAFPPSMAVIPALRPPGSLRSRKIVPDDFFEPSL
jgi:hypothetical protein